MDKGNPKRANGVLTRGNETSHLTLNQTISWEEERRGEKRKKRKRKEREEERGERNSTFFLVFPAIEPSVSVEARGKILPRDKSFK